MSDTVLSTDQLLQQLHWRYATKKFDATRKIPDDLWQILEQTLVLAPSSFGLQPWKFFVVNNPELRQQLVEHAWSQQQVADASHLVVLAIKKDVNAEDVDRYAERMADVRQMPVDSLQGMTNMIKGFLEKPPYPLDINEWSTRQVYIALGQFMTSAALLGIDTCPMEGFNPAKFNELLGLEAQGYSAVVLCPAGYRAEDDKYASLPKVRFPAESVISYIPG
ncbi:MAG: NAD(P)H-dependent oxidoreductase [Leptolyngbyaceae cyanobacterium bins.349]|nr:NAD(P)H-dependent oxidoreductase [Leptolyngbyaceae cyanobacterium bins.349]